MGRPRVRANTGERVPEQIRKIASRGSLHVSRSGTLTVKRRRLVQRFLYQSPERSLGVVVSFQSATSSRPKSEVGFSQLRSSSRAICGGQESGDSGAINRAKNV